MRSKRLFLCERKLLKRRICFLLGFRHAKIEKPLHAAHGVRGASADDVEVTLLHRVGEGEDLYIRAVDRRGVQQDRDAKALGHQLQNEVGVLHLVGDVPPVPDGSKEAVYRVALPAEPGIGHVGVGEGFL